MGTWLTPVLTPSESEHNAACPDRPKLTYLAGWSLARIASWKRQGTWAFGAPGQLRHPRDELPCRELFIGAGESKVVGHLSCAWPT